MEHAPLNTTWLLSSTIENHASSLYCHTLSGSRVSWPTRSPHHEDGNPCQMSDFLTGEAIKEISACSNPSSPPPLLIMIWHLSASPNPPQVPERCSSLVKTNCLVSYEELIKQGRRLSNLLNLTPPQKGKKQNKGSILKSTLAKLLKPRKLTVPKPSRSMLSPDETRVKNLSILPPLPKFPVIAFTIWRPNLEQNLAKASNKRTHGLEQ